MSALGFLAGLQGQLYLQATLLGASLWRVEIFIHFICFPNSPFGCSMTWRVPMSMIFQCIKGLSVAVFLRSGFENARELFGSLLLWQVESGNAVSGGGGVGVVSVLLTGFPFPRILTDKVWGPVCAQPDTTPFTCPWPAYDEAP